MSHDIVDLIVNGTVEIYSQDQEEVVALLALNVADCAGERLHRYTFGSAVSER